MGVGGWCNAPAALPPSKKELVTIVQEAWWAPRMVRMGAGNLTPLGLNPQTVQPTASHYTDYAIG
jgi:hypothetical protein